MSPLALFVLLIVVLLPIAWLHAEFTNSRSWRIALGLASILSAFGVAYLVGQFSHYNYNAWYGVATKELIETTLSEIETGNIDGVVRVFRSLDLDYKPTYESRANYDQLIDSAVSELKKSKKR